MPYVTLSEQLAKLHDPQSSEQFLRLFRAHLDARHVIAATLPSRFEVPQRHTSRNGETRPLTRRDMVIKSTPAFEAWFDQVNRALQAGDAPNPRPKRRTPELTAENIEAGRVDFRVHVARTRRALSAEHERSEARKQLRAEKRSAGTGPVPEASQHLNSRPPQANRDA